MNHQHDPNSPFNPTSYRQAMGPGYSVSLFKENTQITGRNLASRRPPPPLFRDRHRPSLRLRVLLRLDQVLERGRRFTQRQLEAAAPPAANCC